MSRIVMIVGAVAFCLAAGAASAATPGASGYITSPQQNEHFAVNADVMGASGCNWWINGNANETINSVSWGMNFRVATSYAFPPYVNLDNITLDASGTWEDEHTLDATYGPVSAGTYTSRVNWLIQWGAVTDIDTGHTHDFFSP